MNGIQKAKGIEKVNIAQQAARLTEPFTMVDLAQIDDLVLSLFLCQGTLPFHRHLDQDELFLIHSGTISLESEWGNVILRPGELSVAPKGIGHRSSSLIRSTVLLLQPRLMVNRRNGDRRLFALQDGGRLEKISVPAVGRQIVAPFKPVTLADMDTFALNLMLCQGNSPTWQNDRQSTLILCYDGRVSVVGDFEQINLHDGDLIVLPAGTDYRFSSTQRALILGVERHRQPGLSPQA